MTDNQDNARRGRDAAPVDGVADLATRAIAELAARRKSHQSELSESLLGAFVTGALDRDDETLQKAVAAILDFGVEAHDIVDLYIPEAARRLGDSWCSDGLSFAEVTIGSARLQRLVRDLSPKPGDHDAVSRTGSMLVVVRDGEYHTLGAMVATSQLRRAGISVNLLLCRPDREVLDTIVSSNYTVALFSVGAAEKVAGFRDFVARSRDASKGSMKIGMGGAVGHLGEEAKSLTGVDFVSIDAREALRQCDLKTPIPGARLRATKV